jgi:ATP synthase F1
MLIVGLFEKAKLRQKHEKMPYLGQKWCARKTTDGEMAGKKAVFVQRNLPP